MNEIIGFKENKETHKFKKTIINTPIKQSELKFNPFQQKIAWIKLTMVIMYIFFIGMFVVLCIYLSKYEWFRIEYWFSEFEYMYYLIGILWLLFSSISVIYWFSKGAEKRRDEGWFDAWSLGHLFRDMILVLFPYSLGVNLYLSILISLGFAISWELFEKIIITKYWYNLGSEDLTNKISDIVICLIGCGIAYTLIQTFPII